MTIIEPNKNQSKINIFVLLIPLMLILGILLNIYLYNRIVTLHHTLNAALKTLQKIELANADLKNDLYKSVETDNLIALVEKFGLVKENRPDYLENPWVVASHY